VATQVTCHHCMANRIGLDLQADFILAYYMVHETPDPAAFFKETKTLLKEGKGKLLVVEPRMHVTQTAFEAMLTVAREAGFKVLSFPLKKGGHSVLLGLKETQPLHGRH